MQSNANVLSVVILLLLAPSCFGQIDQLEREKNISPARFKPLDGEHTVEPPDFETPLIEVDDISAALHELKDAQTTRSKKIKRIRGKSWTNIIGHSSTTSGLSLMEFVFEDAENGRRAKEIDWFPPLNSTKKHFEPTTDGLTALRLWLSTPEILVRGNGYAGFEKINFLMLESPERRSGIPMSLILTACSYQVEEVRSKNFTLDSIEICRVITYKFQLLKIKSS